MATAQSSEAAESRPVATIRLESRAEVVSVYVDLQRARSGELESRTFHAEIEDGRTLALRIVEYVLASQIEVQGEARTARTEGSLPPPPELSTKPPPAVTPSPNLRNHRAKLELAAMLWVGTVGSRPAIGPAIGAAYGLPGERWWFELRLSGLATGSVQGSVQDADGSADVRHTLGSLGARWNFVNGARFGSFAMVSGGAYALQSSGTPQSEFLASDDAAATLAGSLGGGGFVRLTRSGSFTLVLRVEALFTALRPTVVFEGVTVDRMAQPTLLASLGSEAYF